MSRFGELGGKLYRGEVSYDFVGQPASAGTRISASSWSCSIVGALFVRGLTSASSSRAARSSASRPRPARSAGRRTRSRAAGVQPARSSSPADRPSGRSSRADRDADRRSESQKVAQALAKTFDVADRRITTQLVGPSWGEEITKKALRGLIVFLILVLIFLSIYFEWRMAIAALVALVHDLIITVGIYALIGFEVTPATVIGVLTILGYSLYDTVVVFDKVKENTRASPAAAG